MTKRKCKHFQLPLADPGPCATCEREETSTGPLVSYAGGRDNWRNGETVAETMRQNRQDWAERDIEAVPVDKNRWI